MWSANCLIHYRNNWFNSRPTKNDKQVHSWRWKPPINQLISGTNAGNHWKLYSLNFSYLFLHGVCVSTLTILNLSTFLSYNMLVQSGWGTLLQTHLLGKVNNFYSNEKSLKQTNIFPQWKMRRIPHRSDMPKNNESVTEYYL